MEATLRTSPLPRKLSMLWLVVIALVAAACGEPGTNVTTAPPTPANDVESTPTPGSQESDAPADRPRLDARSLPSDEFPAVTASAAVGLMERRLRAGGSLVFGTLVEFQAEPLIISFEVGETVGDAPTALSGQIVTFSSDGCCEPGLAEAERHVETGQVVAALLDSGGELENFTIEINTTEGRWLEGGQFVAIGALLNSGDVGVFSPACGTSELRSETIDEAIRAFAAGVADRQAYEARVALTDEAERLARGHDAIFEPTGERADADERHVLRQLLNGVAVEDVEVRSAVPISVAGSSEADGSRALVLIDEANGQVLGVISVQPFDLRAWISAPSGEGDVTVYSVFVGDLADGCDSFEPDAPYALTVSQSPEQRLDAALVAVGTATITLDR